MKITRIHETVVPIRSEIRNAYISFAEMTVSAVAVHTDVVRNGTPVVGYGFHSNGRYAQSGILRDRLPSATGLLFTVLAHLRVHRGPGHQTWLVLACRAERSGRAARSRSSS